ncbi:MAG: serine/threonine-protein kinase, partial [Planctomycetota bacterium]
MSWGRAPLEGSVKETDAELARLALARGWISAEAFERVLAAAERARAVGLEKPVDEILADEGLLSEKRLRELKEELGWALRRSRIGDYEVIRRIGIGGTGTVFEARHVRLNVPVALKVLYPRFARRPELARRFLEEARNLASLSHPNLVHALDFGADGEYCYLATEYVEGMDLRQKLLSGGPLGLRSALRIVRDVSRALEFLSSRGLVHRDVKPANILLGEAGPAKLADAGLVRAVGELAGGERFAGGTPHYMAPEQVVRGGSVDARSDIYALGATWYHTVAGRPPFAEFANEALLRAHVERRPPPPSSFRRGVPAALDRAVLRWLSKDPADRPASPAKALREIEELERELDPLARRIAAALGGFSRRLPRGRALAAG